MEAIHERVAGLDVHKDTVVACVRVMSGARVERTCRTFGTTTAALTGLRDWLDETGCTVAAMEATGIYWKPVWNILSDGRFDLVLANAAHIKAVPGRKTDVNDATWIADLIACGLIRSSFVPGESQAELRSLMRTRKQLVREQASHVQRLQKTLEEANIKLASVISDILGVNGRRMIEAMIAGVRNPRRLAELADGRLKASPKQLYDARATAGSPTMAASCSACICGNGTGWPRRSPRSTCRSRRRSPPWTRRRRPGGPQGGPRPFAP